MAVGKDGDLLGGVGVVGVEVDDELHAGVDEGVVDEGSLVPERLSEDDGESVRGAGELLQRPRAAGDGAVGSDGVADAQGIVDLRRWPAIESSPCTEEVVLTISILSQQKKISAPQLQTANRE